MEFHGINLVFKYRYKTVSIDHLDELQEDIDKLRRAGKLSDNKTYRSYIDSKKFEIPETLPNAKSIIIIAISAKPALVDFHLNGKKYEVIIPPNYYDDGTTFKDFEKLIQEDIIKEPGYKIEYTNKLHLKLLAVRSGLGKYGRNNICYVDDWGSMLYLYAYFTDFQFEEDNWTEMKMMDKCENCSACITNCPTHAIPTISNENFVINANKCIPVYNEIKGIIPDWVPPDAHNALIGCMRCQNICPANREIIKLTERFEDITEDETKMLLNGKYEEKLGKSLSKKLKMFTLPDAERVLPVIKRNFSYLLRS